MTLETEMQKAYLRIPPDCEEKSFKAGYYYAQDQMLIRIKRILRTKFGYPASIEYASIRALWREIIGEHEE